MEYLDRYFKRNTTIYQNVVNPLNETEVLINLFR